MDSHATCSHTFAYWSVVPPTHCPHCGACLHCGTAPSQPAPITPWPTVRPSGPYWYWQNSWTSDAPPTPSYTTC